MTTSDSDAFESADEDFLNVNANKSTKLKVVGLKSSVDDPPVSSTSCLKDDVVDNIKVVKKTQQESTDDNVGESNSGGTKRREQKKKERPQRQPIERKPKNAMKLGVKVDVKPDASKVAEASKSTDVIPTSKLEDQGLSDNDWNDFDVEMNPSDTVKSVDNGNSKSEIQTTAPAPAPAVTTEKGKESDGWDDGFEDWGDESFDDPKAHVSPRSSAQHSEYEFKALADRLSSLGDNGVPKVDTPSTPSGGGWGGWGGWGANLLSSGVSQLTSHVSQGFTTVSNVIESGMGVPDPEELVRIQRASKERLEKEVKEKQSMLENAQPATDIHKDLDKSEQQQQSTEEEDAGFMFGKLVSSVTKLVETTGTAVVSGGLDTLEEIGKRTMRVIQGDEPGGRVRLSALLREARDRVEESPPKIDESDGKKVKKVPRFEALFDDYQGLVHLEALEMLSKQCDTKIQSLLNKAHGTELIELKETLSQVKDICELPDPDNEDDDSDGKLDVETFKAKLQEAIKDLGVPLSFENILKCWEEILNEANQPIEESDEAEADIREKMQDSAEDLSHSAIGSLARCSALSVQILHKSTALLSVRERRSTADEADGLTQLTAVLSSHIGEVAAVYSQKLHQLAQRCGNSEKINEFITNVFLEARKGSSYLQDAFLLTIPILQVGAT